jgi:hypothetical protein
MVQTSAGCSAMLVAGKVQFNSAISGSGTSHWTATLTSGGSPGSPWIGGNSTGASHPPHSVVVATTNAPMYLCLIAFISCASGRAWLPPVLSAQSLTNFARRPSHRGGGHLPRAEVRGLTAHHTHRPTVVRGMLGQPPHLVDAATLHEGVRGTFVIQGEHESAALLGPRDTLMSSARDK